MKKRVPVTVDFCHQDNVVTWDSIGPTRQYNQIRCKDLCTPEIKVDRRYAANNEKLESHNIIHSLQNRGRRTLLRDDST